MTTISDSTCTRSTGLLAHEIQNSDEQNLWSVKPDTGLVRAEVWGCL